MSGSTEPVKEKAPFRLGWGAPGNTTNIRGEVWIQAEGDTSKEDVMIIFRDFCDALKLEVEENFNTIVTRSSAGPSPPSPSLGCWHPAK